MKNTPELDLIRKIIPNNKLSSLLFIFDISIEKMKNKLPIIMGFLTNIVSIKNIEKFKPRLNIKILKQTLFNTQSIQYLNH